MCDVSTPNFFSSEKGKITVSFPDSDYQETYAIALDAETIAHDVKHVYRIFDGQETEIQPEGGKYMFDSDSNGQVVVKLDSWPQMTTYGVYIRYQITQK